MVKICLKSFPGLFAICLFKLAAARVDAFTTIQNGVGSLGNLHSVMTGSSAVLACNVSGDPAPNVEWYRDGILVAEAVDSTMPVDNLQATHFYQCAASNTLASDIATQLVCNSAPGESVSGLVWSCITLLSILS